MNPINEALMGEECPIVNRERLELITPTLGRLMNTVEHGVPEGH
jgi:hypothetical protein